MAGRAWRKVAPWLTPLLVAVEVGLVWSGLLGLRDAVILGLVVEALLWVVALRGVVAGVRHYRAGRATGLDLWQSAEAGLAQLVPRSLAKVILFEPRLWVCLARWVTGRYPTEATRAFRYDAGLRWIFWGAAGLVVLEGAAVDVVLGLALPGSIWVWVSLGVHAYALLGVVGFLASWVTRPHLVADDALLVRDGTLNELTVPYPAIRDARAEVRPRFGRSGLRVDDGGHAVLALGDATVALTLDPTQPVDIAGRGPTPLATLRVTVDRPGEFLWALHPRVTAHA